MKQRPLATLKKAFEQEKTLEFLRFLLVGGGGAAAYFGLSLTFYALGLEGWLASISAYATVLVPVYLLQHGVAFRSARPHTSAFPRYVASQAVGIVISAVIPAVLEGSTAMPGAAMFGAVAIVVPLTNYLLLRFWTFRAHD